MPRLLAKPGICRPKGNSTLTLLFLGEKCERKLVEVYSTYARMGQPAQDTLFQHFSFFNTLFLPYPSRPS